MGLGVEGNKGVAISLPATLLLSSPVFQLQNCIMAAREGKEATGQLLQNIQDQLNRLITQLADLEEMKADLEEDEYTSTKAETLQQLKEFEKSLQKTLAGNLSLVDSLSAVRLAIQGAISNAFKTPEVIRMFANKQPAQLRFKLAELQREHKLKNVDKLSFTSQVIPPCTCPSLMRVSIMILSQAVEILAALKRLGEDLSAEEQVIVAIPLT